MMSIERLQVRRQRERERPRTGYGPGPAICTRTKGVITTINKVDVFA